MPNWKLIKEQYCAGIPPRELAKKHKVKAQTISQYASEGNWHREKSKKLEEIARDYTAQVARITNLALTKLEDKLNEDKPDIQEIKAALDISGLKTQKNLNENIDTTPLEIKIVS